jgi:hypothetical protein
MKLETTICQVILKWCSLRFRSSRGALNTLGDLLWRDREEASHGLALNSDGFMRNWWARTRRIKKLSHEG